MPSAGDYVIFHDTVGDTEMTLNLSSDFNLGYVLVTGTKLKISETTGTSTLSVDTFRNTAIAAISTLKCSPTTVVLEGKLRLQSGLGISCEVDSSLADNMKWYYDDDVSAMYFADIWKGTVVFTGYAAANLDLSYWANDDSVVRLNGVAGYLKPNTAFPYTVELIDNGEAAALNWSNGSSGAQSTFSKLTGTGTFQTTAGGGNNEKVLIKDVSGFTGSFNLAAKNVAIADAMPDDATGSNGRLYVEKEVEISAGKGWAANGGLYLGDGADLAVSGAFATGSTINTYGAGAVLTIEDGGSVKVNGAISGDNAPTLNFKAGMYQITQSIRETKTVNFCAASGKRTVVDANGYTLTLGPNVFSGSGDVYLTSSNAGGKIIVEGISADYTGTVYCDISCEVSFGDLSKATNCNINVSDVILSRSSNDVGNLTVGLGARAAQAASSAFDGYWLNGSTVTTGFAFSDPAQTLPQEGYILISTWATDTNPDDHGTAVYSGETLSTLSGGEKTGLRFTGPERYIASVGIGGPTVAGAKPWAGMVVKSVALFDEWVTPSNLAGYQFPEQGAVRPVDSDRYAIEPAASWVNDFKTTTKGGCTLSVGGTTAAKDDTFGGTLTIGNSAAVVDVASTNALTVLVKYRSAPDVHSAPVVTFGGKAAVTFDSGICTDTNVARQLSAYYSFIYGDRKRGLYAVGGNPTLSADGGYLVCARKTDACLAYVGNSLDAMSGGECTTGMTLSNSTLNKIGIDGQTELSNNDANMVPFTGFVVEKVVVFNGYYTPTDLTTFNIRDGETRNFVAGATKVYTNIGALSTGGTIAVTNASELAEGSYTLAT